MVRVKDLLDIITYLSVLTGYASVTEYLGMVHSSAFFALLLLAAYLDRRRIVNLPRWLINSISVLVLALSTLRINPEYLIEPILDALIILIAVKLIEDKKFRDYMQVFGMCIFLLIGSSLISLSAVFLIYFLILVTLLTMALLLLSYFSHNPDMVITRENMTRIATHAVLICSIAIPSCAVFFVILPRTNYPILSFLNQYSSARTGFSDKVTLGEVSEIQEDNSAIFRAEMGRVNENKLYWRGVVLDKFDGISWKSSQDKQETTPGLWDGDRVNQIIYLEPYGNKVLFALDRPEAITLMRHSLRNVITYSLPEHVNDRIRYKAVSVLSDFIPEEQLRRDPYLQLPQGFSPRIQELVQELIQSKAGDDRIRTLTRFLREKNFRYSLQNLPISQVPLEDFLFNTQYGNCEYFASALGVMLRIAGIPARLVGGYKGGFYNATGGYYLVLQKNAHVWVEAYGEKHGGKSGWMRIDPTPYTLETPAAVYGQSFFIQFKLLLDTFNYYWNKFIITYDFQRQLFILNQIRAGIKKPDIKLGLSQLNVRKAILAALGALLLTSIVSGAVLYTRRKERHQRLIAKFLKKMASHGYRKSSSEGLEEFVGRIGPEDLKIKASHFVEAFQRVYYTDSAFSRQEIERLEAQLRRL